MTIPIQDTIQCRTVGDLRRALKNFPSDTPFFMGCFVTIYYEEKPKIIIE